MMRLLHGTIAAALALMLTACAGAPDAPTKTATVAELPAVPPTLPVLLAGQSNAVVLRDEAMRDTINVVQGGTGIDEWVYPTGSLSKELREKAARGGYSVFVWWQGEHDGTMPQAEYAAKLRSIIAYVREGAGHDLPVRIIEIAVSNHDPNLMSCPLECAAKALFEVAADPGNALIQTDDLPWDPGAHFMLWTYPVIRDRIYRSLVRR